MEVYGNCASSSWQYLWGNVQSIKIAMRCLIAPTMHLLDVITRLFDCFLLGGARNSRETAHKTLHTKM